MNPDVNFQTVRDWVEIISFASQVILAAAALYGLQQIRILKKDMQTRNERSAKEKAIEYSARYLTRFVDLHKRYAEERDSAKVSRYKGPIGDFTRNSLKREQVQDAIKHLRLNAMLSVLNELHIIASVFVVGVADERTGFGIIGRSFCDTVASLYDAIAACREHGTYQYHQSVVDLYKIWAPRLNKAELETVREQVDKRISEIPDSHISPLGLG